MSFPPRARPNPNSNRRVESSVSLDDLVDEDKQIEEEAESSRQTNGGHDDEEDELEAYMASIEQAHSKNVPKNGNVTKRIKIVDQNHDSESDQDQNMADDEEEDEVLLSQKSSEKQDVENLKADVEAAIAGTNSSANKTIKKLNQIGHRPAKYPEFKKDFYQEVPELVQMSQEEVEELRMSLENIKVVGKSCPKPITCWPHCGLSKRVMEVLKKSNYLSPTPIQAQAIPAIMSGRDVIGIAKTGCGKTMSFLLPMFRHIMAQPELERGDGPIAIIITPTRELATQICDDAQRFTKNLGLRVVAVYGGPNISEQIGMLKPGAEIVVCTPGRMIEILTVNSGRVTNLNRCTYLVLDEADRLFDMGFEKQIRSIVDLIRPDRQTVMFSATFPKILEAHARKILTNPIAIQVGGRSIVCKDVHQTVEIIEEDDKFLRLLEIFRRHVDKDNSAIVFVAKQEKADSLLEDLMQAYDSNCLVLHGGIDRDDRISTFSSFKKGQARVLVATSVAARGLDVKSCICVVNYDCPNHYEDYVHRCGRTGRANNKGFAYTFITPDQGQHAPDIIKALELSGFPVPGELQKLWDNYKSEAEKTGKKIWTSSGFSGRGFKFDEAEAQLVNEKKKYQKKSCGMQNSSDEEDDGGTGGTAGDSVDNKDIDTSTLEAEIHHLAGVKRGVARPVFKVIGGASSSSSTSKTEPKRSLAAAAAAASAAASFETKSAVVSTATPVASGQVMSKLDLVKHRAAMLCKKKGLEATSGSAGAGEPSSEISTDPNKQQAIAETPPAHTRVGPMRSVSGAIIQPISGSSDSAEMAAVLASNPPAPNERLEMQMEINDFHQQVRRRLTSKETLNKVSEHCEVGITVRGQFCPPGDRPSEPKLYLAIEGTTQSSLEDAHRELLLVVKDEYNRINSQPASRGRYRIV